MLYFWAEYRRTSYRPIHFTACFDPVASPSSDQPLNATSRQILWSVACTTLHVCIWKKQTNRQTNKTYTQLWCILGKWYTWLTYREVAQICLVSAEAKYCSVGQISLGEAVQKAGMQWDLTGWPVTAATHTAAPATSITGVQKRLKRYVHLEAISAHFEYSTHTTAAYQILSSFYCVCTMCAHESH